MDTYSVSMPSKAEIYMRTLSPLADNIKIELINLLSRSLMKRDAETVDVSNADLYNCFKGNWGEGMSTEEYCDMLRNEGVNTLIND